MRPEWTAFFPMHPFALDESVHLKRLYAFAL